MLAEDNPDDGVLARNARPVLTAVSQRLRAAPSLLSADAVTDPVTERVTGHLPGGDPGGVDDGALDGLTPATAGRRGILDLALTLNTLLPAAATHARVASDRRACTQGTRPGPRAGVVLGRASGLLPQLLTAAFNS